MSARSPRLGTALAALALGALSGGCALLGGGSLRTIDVGGYPGAARVAKLDAFVVAIDATRGCSLESAPGEADSPDDWKRQPIGALLGRRFRVRARGEHRDGSGNIDALVVRVEDDQRRTLWLRNAPSTSTQSAARAWRCAIDADDLSALAPKSKATRVRLALERTACAALSPIYGDRRDLAPGAYVVADVWPVVGEPAHDAAARDEIAPPFATTLGVVLHGDGDARRLVVPAPTFDRCFVEAPPGTAAPPRASDAEALAAWLARGDDADPPEVSLETFVAVAGVDEKSCSREGTPPVEHVECRAPLATLRFAGDEGAFGTTPARVVRRRARDAFHFYGGRLVPAREIVDANVVVRPPKLPRELAAPFADALAAAVASPGSRERRASYGARLLRPSDAAPLGASGWLLDADVHVGGSAERRVHAYFAPPAPAASTPGPEVARVLEEQAAARRALAGLRAEAGLAKAAEGVAARLLGRAVSNAASLPGVGAIDEKLLDAAEERASAADEAADALADATPAATTLAVPVEKSASSKITEVDLTVTLSDATRRQKAWTATRHATFSTTVAEGAPGAAPGRDDGALAAWLVATLDALVEEWTVTRETGVATGALADGSRARLATAARAASSARSVALLDDVVDARADASASGVWTQIVHVAAGAEGRCLTFAASAVDGATPIRLDIRRAGAVEGRVWTLATDARGRREAAVELCGLPAGDYALVVGAGDGGAVPGSIATAVYDTTKGVGTAATLRDAVAGKPREVASGDAPTLGTTRR